MQSQKLNVLQRVLRDKFLLQGLGVPNSNTVLNRSFTALLLALLLEDSNNKSWISEEDQIKIMNQACSWLIDEPDLLTEIVKMKYFSKDDSLKILTIIKRVMITDDILTLNG
ncbi:TPA: DUF2785 domain-containing protein [Streptococcus agalactiae]|nr:DUF2785 domain-containing protein [Streptococcus agalactiae]HEN9255631.1 DUF2785 domain-containing protein [Streptococcus agalactiae]